MNPALEILHSTDLVNWEHVGYCMNRLDFGPRSVSKVETSTVVASWAPCIRYHKGT